VAQDVRRDFLDEGGREIVAAAQPSEGAAGLVKRERGAGRGAEVEVAFPARALFREGAGAADEGEDVALRRPARDGCASTCERSASNSSPLETAVRAGCLVTWPQRRIIDDSSSALG
jgi:hypothetical protein